MLTSQRFGGATTIHGHRQKLRTGALALKQAAATLLLQFEYTVCSNGGNGDNAMLNSSNTVHPYASHLLFITAPATSAQ